MRTPNHDARARRTNANVHRPLRGAASAIAALIATTIACGAEAQPATPGARATAVRIAGGTFSPFFDEPNAPVTRVPPFRIDRHAVTNADYARFTVAHPEWAHGAPPEIFADIRYLQHWGTRSAQAVIDAPTLANQPVTFVSWFAATAYCESQGGRLPSEAEWELVGQASEDKLDASGDAEHAREILSWYERARQGELSAVAQRRPNAWGVYDMHGLVWEWISDFNASMTAGGRRGITDQAIGLFCGSAAANARTPTDYAAFMRYAFRSSLRGSYVMHSLGFRCAYDDEETPQ